MSEYKTYSESTQTEIRMDYTTQTGVSSTKDWLVTWVVSPGGGTDEDEIGPVCTDEHHPMEERNQQKNNYKDLAFRTVDSFYVALVLRKLMKIE